MAAGSTYRYKELPDKLYKVIVPTIATYSDADLKRSGMLPTRILQASDFVGQDILDQISQESPLAAEVTVMIPISRMIDIYVKGYPIRVVLDKDVVEIYNVLEDYYSGSATEPEEYFNSQKYYDDRLPMIDSFIEEIFKGHTVDIALSRISPIQKSKIANNGFLGYVPLHSNPANASRFSGSSFNPSSVESTGIMRGYNVTYADGRMNNNYTGYRNAQPARPSQPSAPLPPRQHSLRNNELTDVKPDVSNVRRRGYVDIETRAEREMFRDKPKDVNTTAQVLEGNYINMNLPQLDLEKLKSYKRPDRPSIDLDMYRK